ncbi:MAG TPA: BatA domain-containing protein [Gemmatimonadaceae bacterium]|nr:BatA domain-containing protein [Gemmatimonadaceae bacterium]
MTLLAPGFLYGSLAIGAAIMTLHFLVTRQPRSSFLPTARFVPDTRATTIAPASRPSDLSVMLLRVLMVVAAGLALARPIVQPSRRPQARVVLVDVSRSVGDTLSLRDSARTNYRDGDALVLFDSAARVIGGNAGDTLGKITPSGSRGSLSAALISALRAASTVRDRADSLELVIVSPFGREEFDAATDSIRSLWPGRARLVTVGARRLDTMASAVGELAINADSDDPLAIAVALARPSVKSKAIIDRAPLRAAAQDSVPTGQSHTASIAGGAFVDWPSRSRPRGAVRRAVADTVGGVIAEDRGVIAPFERHWSFPTDSLRGADVIARWVDGEPAAIERPADAGCLRSVAIPVASVGDLAIRRDFVRFVAAMSRPCARATALVPADANDVARLAGRSGLAPRGPFQSPGDRQSSLAPWLLGLAILAAISELFVRRRARNNTALNGEAALSGEARAA